MDAPPIGVPHAASNLRSALSKVDLQTPEPVTESYPGIADTSSFSNGKQALPQDSGDRPIADEVQGFETVSSDVTQEDRNRSAKPKGDDPALDEPRTPTSQIVRSAQQDFDTPQTVEVHSVIPEIQVEPGEEIPLYHAIGLHEARRNRREWKGMLKTVISSKAKDRDSRISAEVLVGNLDDSDVLSRIQASMQRRCIRILFCSTAADTEFERELILSDVLPFLQEYATKNRIDLNLLDLDLGWEESSPNVAAQDLSRQLLQSCIDQSKSFALCHLTTHKYGFRSPPARIPQRVMDSWLTLLEDEASKASLRAHYTLDLNCVARQDVSQAGNPESGDESLYGEYVLNSDSKAGGAPDHEERVAAQLLDALQQAAEVADQDADSDAFAPARSLVDGCIRHLCKGGDRAADVNATLLLVQRTITDIDAVPADDPLKPVYVDMLDGAPDEEAQRMLAEMQGVIPAEGARVAGDAIEWGPGLDPSLPAHAAYLEKLADGVCSELCGGIEQTYTSLAVKPDAVVTETSLHLLLAHQRAQAFCETATATAALASIASYLQAGALGHGMVVHGRCGCGKTTLMGRAVMRRAREGRGVVVARFLGQTRQSRSLPALVESMVRQLGRVYGRPCGDVDDWRALCRLFTTAIMEWPSAEQPLALFLDGLDQLDDYQGGRRLDWLPVKGLPDHVRVVVSTRPDNDLEVPVAAVQAAGAAPEGLGAGGTVGIGAGFWCLSLLQKRLKAENVVCVDGRVDHAEVVEAMLRRKGRRVTAEQQAACEQAVRWRADLETAGDTMLWLALLSDVMSRWSSADGVKQPLGCSVQEVVSGLLSDLEERHGAGIARGLTAYLSYCKSGGLSETEMLHLLSLDDDALADAYRQVDVIPSVRVMPARCALAALSELSPLLLRRVDGAGFELVGWRHSSIRIFSTQWLEEREGIVGSRRRHEQLADFFGGVWADTPKRYSPVLAGRVQDRFPGQARGLRMVPRQPLVLQGSLLQRGAGLALNVRRLEELVHHQILAGREETAVKELCSIEYMTAKQTSGMGVGLLAELSHAMQVFSSSGERLHQAMSFLRRNERMLKNDKIGEAPFQLAMQEPASSPVKKHFAPESPALQDRIGGKCRLVEWLNKREEAFPCLMSLAEHEGQVNAVACSPDGARVASGGNDNLIKICRLATGELEMTLRGHTHWVNSIAFSADGEVLASGSVDQTVRVWDVKRGEERFVLSSGSAVNGVCVSADGSVVAGAGTDKMIRVWDLRPSGADHVDDVGTGGDATPVRPKQQRKAAGCCCCFMSRSKAQGVVQGGLTPEAEAGGEGPRPQQGMASEPVLRGVLKGHTSWVNAVGFHADGVTMISGSNDEIKLWNLLSMQEKATMVGHDGPVNAVAFGGNGRVALSGGSDGVIKIWDLREGCLERGSFSGHLQSVTSLAVDPSGDYIVSGSNDKQVKLWQLSTMQEAGVLVGVHPHVHRLPCSAAERQGVMCAVWQDGHTRGVKGVAFSPDGKSILSGGSDGLVKVWERNKTGGGRHVKAHSHTVSAVSMSRDGRRAASASLDGSLRVWDAETGGELSPSLKGHTDRVMCMALSPDGTAMVSGSQDYTVRLWDAVAGRERKCMTGHTHRVTQVVFSSDGKTVASSSIDKTVRLWDVETGKRKGQTLEGHFEGVSALAMSPDCTRVASGSYDNDVRLYLLPVPQGGEQGGRLRGHTNWLKALSFSPDSRTLASAGDDASIRLWDCETGSQRAVLSGHNSWVTWLAFSHDGLSLVSGSQGDVRLWDVESGQSKGPSLIGTCCALHAKASSSSAVEPPATPRTPGTPSTGVAAAWFVVTADMSMVRVYQVTPRKKKADDVKLAACFFVPSPVRNVSACGGAICAGCDTGDVLMLRAAFMAP